MITRSRSIFFLLLVAGLLWMGFEYTKIHNSDNTVVIYSSRKENLLSEVLSQFSKETGLKIKYVEDEAPQLILRIKSEEKHPSADIFLTADAANLILSKKMEILDRINSDFLTQRIPESFRNEFWVGLTKRARIFAYNKNLVSQDQLNSYIDLADPKWANSILVRSSTSPYNQSLIAFMIATNGEQATRLWVRGLVKNMARKPSGGDIDQIYAVAAAEGKIAIVNSYYLARILASDDPKDKKAASSIGIFFPNQSSGGTMMNISGGAIVKGAPHKDNALKLLEFLAGDYAQSVYAKVNHEYPIVQNIEISDELKKWNKFLESNLPLSKLEEFSGLAVKIAQEEGWS